MERAEELVLIGKITKPHGIHGEVKVYPFSGMPENFLHYPEVLLEVDGESALQARAVARARVQKNFIIVQFAGCTTRNEAETLVGGRVFVREQDLPQPAKNEFYLRELEDKQMVTVDGDLIGRVTGILITGGQDIARVNDGRHEYMIPLVPEFLVDIDEDRVTVALPPGLLDINS